MQRSLGLVKLHQVSAHGFVSQMDLGVCSYLEAEKVRIHGTEQEISRS